jgi:hypothetical protein
MNILLHPTYFPSISHFAAMVQSDHLEVADNFQKQTNRNRAYIYSPNGIQLLTFLKNIRKKVIQNERY